MITDAPFKFFDSKTIFTLSRGDSLTPEELTKLSQQGEDRGYFLLLLITRNNGETVYRPFDYIRRPNYWNMLLGIAMGVWRDSQQAQKEFGSLVSSEVEGEAGSDKWDQIWGANDTIFNIKVEFKKLLHGSPRSSRAAVGSFEYISRSSIDLKEAQIYQEHELATRRTERITHCLLFSLRQAGIEESLVQSVASISLSNESILRGGYNYVSVSDLKGVANLLKRPIILSRMNKNGKAGERERKTTIGKEFKDKESIHLAVYENHIFHNKEVKTNKNTLKNSLDSKHAIHGVISKKNMLWVVHHLHLLGAFTKMNAAQVNAGRDESLDDFVIEEKLSDEIMITQANLETDQREFKHKERKARDEVYFAADSESFCFNPELKHEIALLGIAKITNPCDWKSAQVKIWSYLDDPVYSMLKFIYNTVNNLGSEELPEYDTEEFQEFEDHIAAIENRSIPNRKRKREKGTTAVVYFHNLRYDRAVIQSHLNIYEILESDSHLYFMKVKFRNLLIEFRDSYKHLSMSLDKLGKALNLPLEIRKKECGIIYTYFKPENYGQRCNVNDYIASSMNTLKREDMKDVLSTISKFNASDDTFEPWELYCYYLHFDILSLACGLYVYQDTGIQLSRMYLEKNNIDIELDPLSFITKSSFSKSMAQHGGVFDETFEYCGNLRRYIMQSIRGGRVACHPEFEGKITEASESGIIYMDAVSEYPSAMVQICEDLGGLPTGPAHLMVSKDCMSDPMTMYYIAKIRITAIPRKLIFSYPIIARKDPHSQSIDYIQDLPDGKPFEVTIGKIDLEEYIKFHQVEFEFISGIKWLKNTAPNPEWGQMITHLFNQRKIYKKAGNIPMSNQIKDNMNSQYGSCITKMHDFKHTILTKTREDVNQAIANIFHSIIEIYDLGKVLQLKRSNMDTGFVSCLAGSIVLCMSRRINNRLLSTLENCGVYALYGDTDSCMFDSMFLPLIRDEYKRQHNLELEGSELGQFHSDFESIQGCIDDNAIRSKRLYLVGKKIYCHETYGPTHNGSIVHGRQFKCKGIPKKSIEYAALTKNPDDIIMGISTIYSELVPLESDYDEEGKVIDRSIPFLCNPYGSVRFVYAKNRTVRTPSQAFFRKISRKPVRHSEIMKLGEDNFN